MKSLATISKRRNSAHIVEIKEPHLDLVPGGCGVLLRTLQVGVDATDAEINQGVYYGQASKGDLIYSFSRN